MMRRFSFTALLFTTLAYVMLWQACTTKENTIVAEPHRLPDTLRVGTIYSPTTFFLYRGDTLGYEYERICDFAADKGIKVDVTAVTNIQALIKLIQDHKVDVLAYEIPVTAEYNQHVLHCGETNTTYQVLVQPKRSRMLRDVTQLINKDVYVEAGSKYESRLRNLDSEVGGGIRIHAISSDTLSTEDLIEQVSKGIIPYTIVDSDIARLNQTYYSNIDVNMEVSFPQRSSWAVNINDDWLADSIDDWSRSEKTQLITEDLTKRYFEVSKNGGTQYSGHHSNASHGHFTLHAGDISPYDSLFKANSYASSYGWQFLAAIAKVESDFNPDVVSWAGARGLMQIMPSTAKLYGFNPDDIFDPEISVKAAARTIKDLDNLFAGYIQNPMERRRFVLAGYNAGAGHILDAIKLAEKYDKNPNIWYGNVEEALIWKSNEKYYSDPVCRYGYFRADQTVNYVRKVEDYYNKYQFKH
jgi:membrane-bound lytic murein transglycosylase F